MSGGLRVVLAEDGLVVRAGLVAVLEGEGVVVAAACGDLDGLLAAVDEHRPDVVLTDIRMPPSQGDEGIQAARRLRRSHPELGVVVLSQFVEPAYALALLEDGSNGRGYLLKERVSEPARLVGALQAVAVGGSFIDPEVVDALVRARGADRRSPLERLTAREREILAEVATGKGNAAIAASLHISGHAVEKHINSIFAKLGLTGEAGEHRRVTAALTFLADAG